MRIFETVNKSIETDILTAQEDMENIFNNIEIETHDKVARIKLLLNKIVTLNLMSAQLSQYTVNNNIKEEENNGSK